MIACSPPIPERRNARTQGGAATLLIGLVLTFASALLALGVAHTTTLEQRMSRNTLLAQQAQQAAAAGLDYGKAWLKSRQPEWVVQADGSELSAPQPNPPDLRSAGGGSFAVNVAFERRPAWRGYLRVHATASPTGAPEIEASASQFVRPLGVLTAAGEEAPPLVVDGCVDLGNMHDLYPQAADTPEAGVAVASSSDCVHRGANLHGGTIQNAAFATGDLWSHLFTVNREEFRELAAAQSELMSPATEHDYWWASAADLSGGEWRMNLGSPQRPIVLVIPQELGCPRLSGGVQIVGLVFIEADCSGAPGWGDARIFGSLVVRGDFASLGPASRLLHIGHVPGGPARIEPPPLELVQLAGSWRDF